MDKWSNLLVQDDRHDFLVISTSFLTLIEGGPSSFLSLGATTSATCLTPATCASNKFQLAAATLSANTVCGDLCDTTVPSGPQTLNIGGVSSNVYCYMPGDDTGLILTCLLHPHHSFLPRPKAPRRLGYFFVFENCLIQTEIDLCTLLRVFFSRDCFSDHLFYVLLLLFISFSILVWWRFVACAFVVCNIRDALIDIIRVNDSHIMPLTFLTEIFQVGFSSWKPMARATTRILTEALGQAWQSINLKTMPLAWILVRWNRQCMAKQKNL